jgi:hypothetical protein
MSHARHGENSTVKQVDEGRHDEAIRAANGEMARIRKIVRKPMSFSLMF